MTYFAMLRIASTLTLGLVPIAACSSVPDLKFVDDGDGGVMEGGIVREGGGPGGDSACPNKVPGNATFCCDDVACAGPDCDESLCAFCTVSCAADSLCCMGKKLSTTTCVPLDSTCS